MEFKKATKEDLPKIMEIIGQAKEFFKTKGINQWQDNYPNEEVITDDINKGESYILVKDDKIIGTVAVSFEKEIAYEKIYEGKWLSNNDYCVIHRIAVHNDYKGLGISHNMIKCIERLCIENGINSIKIDTDENNNIMKGMLKKNSFEYCGLIYYENNNKKIAFEKLF